MFFKPVNRRAKEARESAKLLALALSQSWPISPDAKEKAVQSQIELLDDPLVPSVVKAMAVKNLVSMTQTNMKCIEVASKMVEDTPEEDESLPIVSDADLADGVQRLLGNDQRQVG